MRCISLPKFSGKSLNVAYDLVPIVESWMPAQGSIAEDPQVVVDGHIVRLGAEALKVYTSFLSQLSPEYHWSFVDHVLC